MDCGYAQEYGAEVRREKTFDYDRPPIWDGKDPEKGARMYIRMLRMWLRRTATREKDRGIAILTNARGDLKAYFDELTDDEILDSAFNLFNSGFDPVANSKDECTRPRR